MKRTVSLIIAAIAICFSAHAQIVSSHYNDSFGSPYFRLDGMMSSVSQESSLEEGGGIAFPSSEGFHGLGFNASVGYYIPIFRSYFFFAPEIGLTGRFGSDRSDSDDKYYRSYTGIGLKLVPLQFGYQFEISPSFSVCPRIGMAATVFPFGKVTQNNETSTQSQKWDSQFETMSLLNVLGCDLVFKDRNLILSFNLENGGFSQAGIGVGLLF